MRCLVLSVMLALALIGCQSKTGSVQTASAPHLIQALTDQTMVYSCPKCGMDYDGPGKCTMCSVDLVQTRVDYVCPVDNKPVGHAGKCPNCDADARVVKTAMAAPAGASGGS